MKKIFLSLLTFLVLNFVAFCQEENNVIQKPTLGIHFILNDFESATNIRNTSLATALKNKQFGKLRNMSAGLAINYLKGITEHLDLSTTLAASFLDYPFKNGNVFGRDNLLLKLMPR